MMFPTSGPSVEHTSYDFYSEENTSKWKYVFFSAIGKVQKQVHPSLSIKDDALQFIESVMIQMLSMLCAGQPHSVADVEDRVQKKIPHPIDQWAITDAQAAIDKPKNRRNSHLVLPVDKIHQTLVKDVLGYKIEHQVTVYIVAVLEYIAADILKLTGNYVKNIKHQEIGLQDIKIAICADKVLMELFFQDDEETIDVDNVAVDHTNVSQTYEEIVKDLILEENQFLRDLNMIIRVFREPFVRLYPRSKDLEVIFSNIVDIHELTQNLLSSLEDTLEATEESETPLIGSCFEELTENIEFDVYEKYADDILKENGRMRLNALLQNADAIVTLESLRRGFRDAVKYVLPRMLFGPVFHFLHYYDTLKTLIDKSPDEEDRQSLEQSLDMLNPRKVDIEKLLATKNVLKRKPGLSRYHGGRASREIALNKMNELQKSIDGWEGKDIGQSCNEYIMEGPLKVVGRRLTDRYVFLFDGLIILTKQNLRRISVTGPVADYKLKEKFHVRKIDIVDREDTEDLKNAFEIQVRQHPSVILAAKTSDEKNTWLGALFSLLTWSMLERLLDSKLKEEESRQPLKLPSPDQYRFAVEDSDDNIVFEDQPAGSVRESPLIRGGTLLKLVERLTYHTYADPKFAKTFLTTYRTFCRPDELLALLVERFEIPEPPMSSSALPAVGNDSIDTESDVSLSLRDDLKRFRNEYSKPVQFRVLNVLRHWVDQHWYDFEWNEELLGKLQNFLSSVKGKAMKKWVESINKIIARKKSDAERQKQIILKTTPPPIEYHLYRQIELYDIMTLHPIEIARQVTLLEFDLYRLVKPSEMVGSVWMKKDKNTTSRNLLKMVQHSTKFTFWLEKCIVETENLEERVAVVSRILEVMTVLQELNNFSGVVEVVSALNSAPVHRLEHTFSELPLKLMKSLEEAKELISDHYKRYLEKLRSIDPPCVPFLGMYLTNILHTEEGNPDFLPNQPDIINFSKRRKVAEITGEIQQYQNQPYCLTVEPTIRSYFDSLDPLGGQSEKDFNDYLYNKSLEIEPRNQKPPKFEKRREYSLKSPGIKPVAVGRHVSLVSPSQTVLANGCSNTTTISVSKETVGSLTSSSSVFGSSSTLSSRRLLHATNLPSSSQHSTMADEDMDLDLSSSCGTTPPTPSTPVRTPTDFNVDADDNNSVFRCNPSMATSHPSSVSGFSSRCSSTSTLCASVVELPATVCFPAFTDNSDAPPPLPPRMRRRDCSQSGSETLSPPPDAVPPLLPRRDSQLPANNVNAPPPLPPRRSVHDHTPVLHRRTPRHGAEDSLPLVPPRTYRHSRQSSS